MVNIEAMLVIFFFCKYRLSFLSVCFHFFFFFFFFWEEGGEERGEEGVKYFSNSIETLNLRKSTYINKLETRLNRLKNMSHISHIEKQLYIIELSFIMVSYDRNIQRSVGLSDYWKLIWQKRRRVKRNAQKKIPHVITGICYLRVHPMHQSSHDLQ